MATELDETALASDATPPAEGIQFTARETALIEGRDPNEVAEVEAPPDETVVEEQPAEVADTTTATAADLPVQPWFDEADIAYAADRGIDAYDLYRFPSREAFQGALWTAERMVSGRKESAPAAPAETTVKAAEYVDEPTLPDGRINVEYFVKHEYDTAQIAAFKAMRAEQDQNAGLRKQYADLEERNRQQEGAARIAEQNRQINAFHDAVDALRPDFYGKSVDKYGNSTGRLSPEHFARRKTLFNKANFLVQELAYEQQQSGQQVAMPSWSWIVKQAEQRAFGEEIAKLEQARKIKDAKAQAAAICPAAGSSGAGHARRSAPKATDDARELSNDPDIVAAFAAVRGK